MILHDIQLEQALIGYLIANQKSFAVVKPIIERLEYFRKESHRTIYTAFLDLEETPWDELIIGNFLKRSNKLDGVGGYAYLANLQNIAPSKCNIAYYAKLLRESYMGLKACDYTNELHQKILAYKSQTQDAPYSIGEAVTDAIQKLQTLQASLGARKNKVRAVSEIMPQIWREMEEISKTGITPALSTGFARLDAFLGGGLYRSEFNLVAARPSIGKTSFALNVANNCSPETKILFISLETTSESISRDRLIPLVANVTSTNVRLPKNLRPDDWDRLGSAINTFGAYKKFKICDQATMTIGDIELLAATETGAKGGGIDLIIIDYLQLVRPVHKTRYREQDIAEISQRLKAVIKEHNLFSLVLAQLNRETEKHKRKPIFSDLRESGQLEQDADTIIFLHQEKEEDGQEEKPHLIIVAKNKNGPRGEAEFYFNKKFTRFEGIERR